MGDTAVVYVRLIPPGAADTVHFRMKVPTGAGSKITLTARLCYRKFRMEGTQFAFAGAPEPVQPSDSLTPTTDDVNSPHGFLARDFRQGEKISRRANRYSGAEPGRGGCLPRAHLPSAQSAASGKMTGNAGTITASGCFCRVIKSGAGAFEKVTEADPQI